MAFIRPNGPSIPRRPATDNPDHDLKICARNAADRYAEVQEMLAEHAHDLDAGGMGMLSRRLEKFCQTMNDLVRATEAE